MLNISIGERLNSQAISLSPRRLSSSGGPQDKRKENNIYTPTTCVIFSLLPSSSGSFSLSASNQPETAPNSLRLSLRLDPPPPQSTTIQIPPDLSSFFVLAVPRCVFSSKRPSLSPCPSLLLLKCVISPSHHHRASKTAHRYFFLIPGSAPKNPSKRKKHFEKRFKKRKRKRDQDVKVPRNVSTFLAGEKATPAVRLRFF